MNTTETHDHPALTPILRWMANMLSLHGLCANAACRRARACKRQPRECLARYAPLVPEDVSEGVAALLEGRRHGLGYDELREEAPDLIAAVEDWTARVDESSRTRTRHARA